MVVSGFAKTLLFFAPMCTFSPILLCDGTGAGTHSARRKMKGHLLPRTYLKHLGGLFPDRRNFAPEAAAGRLAVYTAPKEGGKDGRNCTMSCPAVASSRCLREEYQNQHRMVHWRPGIHHDTW